MSKTIGLVAILLMVALRASAATWYVDATSGNNANEGHSWSMAKQSIQAAINVAEGGDAIQVTNGVYGPIAIANKVLTIQSVNGAAVTIIDGGGSNRCATLGNSDGHTNTVLVGFTLRNGYTDESGGGSECGTLIACTLTENTAVDFGGGSFRGTLNTCTFSGNRAGYGGGASFSTLNTCKLSGNTAEYADGSYGGGAYQGTLNNCTVFGNTADYGGGSAGGTLKNCIVWGNSDSEGITNNYSGGTFAYTCTTPLPAGKGNLDAVPLFENLTMGDVRLQLGSPCIDAGTNSFVKGVYDLAGNARIYNGIVDMGAYEYRPVWITVFFDAQGGAVLPATQGYIVGTTYRSLPIPTIYTGCFWDGWWTEAGGAGERIEESAIVTVGVTNLYAKWVAMDAVPVAPGSVSASDGLYTNKVRVTWAASIGMTGYSVYRGTNDNYDSAQVLVDGVQATDYNDTSAVTGTIYTYWVKAVNDFGVSEFSPGDHGHRASEPLLAADYYADASRPDDSGDGLSWETAKRSIQAAIVVAAPGEFVLVTDGVYGPISSTNKRLAVQSVNGAAASVINGGGRNRCATLGRSSGQTNTVLVGFTLQNGYTDEDGGGSFCGTLNNCTLLGNSARCYGGGSAGGTLNNCTLTGNTAESGGGGSAGGTLNNCTLSGNKARYGGGSTYGVLNNCTLSGNSAEWEGGGSYQDMLNNCIVWGNTNAAGRTNNYFGGTISYTCTTPWPMGEGNITADPLFVDEANGDLRLQPFSPCIDLGTNSGANGSCDLAGNARIFNGTVDLGAYEYSLERIRVTVRFDAEGGAVLPESLDYFVGSTYGRLPVPTIYTGCAWAGWWTGEGGTGERIETGNTVAIGVTNLYAKWLPMQTVPLAPGSVSASDGLYLHKVRVTWLTSDGVTGYSVYRGTNDNIDSAQMLVDGVRATDYDDTSAATGTLYTYWVKGVNDVGASAFSPGDNGRRAHEPLCAADYYADASRRDDSGNGLSWETAKRTIQAAIVVASPGARVLVADGVYEPFSSANKALVIRSVNGAAVSIIDGVGNNRCATLGSSEGHTNTVLVGFTMQNGYATASGGGSYGGTLNNCTLTGNTSGTGGGASGGTLNNCSITGNTAESGGGGSAGGTLNNCTLTGNTAESGGGSWGGTLNHCTLIGNTAGKWGGGSVGAVLNYCTLSGNTAEEYGGGSRGGSLSNCTLTGNSAGTGGGASESLLSHCALTGNTAEIGGGASGGTLINCTLSGNSAGTGGGTSESVLKNCTLTGNSAGIGGGVHLSSLNSCIAWGNTNMAGQRNNYFGGTFSYTCTSPLPSGMGNGNRDPMFVDAANGDLQLQAGSPCVDSGGWANWAFDLAGNARIYNGTIDMGAYESDWVTITLAPNSSGAATKDPDAAYYHGGSAVRLTATPDPGMFFACWNGDMTGTNNPMLITVTNNMSISAIFEVNGFAVLADRATVNVPEGGSATFQVKLSAQPMGGDKNVIVASTSGDSDITVSGGSNLLFTYSNWDLYQTVTLYAAEDNGDNENGSARITCSGNYVVPAVVTAKEGDDDFTLSVTSPCGSVDRNPDAPYYDNGTQVTLTAIPDVFSFFRNWTGALATTNNPSIISMDGNKSVTANYGSAVPELLPPKAIGTKNFTARWKWVESFAPEGELNVASNAAFTQPVPGYEALYVVNRSECLVTNLLTGKDYWYRIRRVLPDETASGWSSPMKVRTGKGMPVFKNLLSDVPVAKGISQEFAVSNLTSGVGTLAVKSSNTNAVKASVSAGVLKLQYLWKQANSAKVTLTLKHPATGYKASYGATLSQATGGVAIVWKSALINAGTRVAQEITVENRTGGMIYGVRVRAKGLERQDWLINRTGVDPVSKAAILEIPCVLPADFVMVVRLVYNGAYKKQAKTRPVAYGAWAIMTPVHSAKPVYGEMTIAQQDPYDGLWLLGLPANRNRLYTVYQSDDDAVTWTPNVPAIRATANYLMWLDTDEGAPANRMYRVVDMGM